jgi:MFS family permease
MQTGSSPPKRDLAFPGMAVASALGAFGFFSVPFVVGAAADVFASPSAGAIVAALEFAAVGAASFATAVLSARMRMKAAVLLGALVIVAGHLLTALSFADRSLALLFAARLIVGLGEGVVYALANVFATRRPNPTRAFSIFAVAQVIFSMATFAVMTRVFTTDPVVMALVFAGASAVIFPVLLLAPADPISRAADSVRGGWRLLPVDAKLALGALAAFWTAAYLMIPFVERIGLQHGFSRSEIATVISLHSLPSFLGSAIAAFLGPGLGARLSVLLIIALEAGALAVIMYVPSFSLWSGGILGFTLVMYIFFPLFNGALAQIDPSGRAAMLTVTVAAASAVAGPLVAAALVSDTAGYGRIMPAALIVYGLMAVLAWGPLRQTNAAALAKTG